MIQKLTTLAASAVFLASTVAAQEVLAIKAGTVNLGTGQTPMENAVILIKDGRIEQIGTKIEVPWNARVIDASGKYVMPAWVQAHSFGGLDISNEAIQVTPFLSVMDSIDPVNSYFEGCRRAGIGIIHVMPGNACAIGGRGVVVRPFGKTPEQMAIIQEAGMKMSLEPSSGGRSKHVADLRRALDDAKAHMEDLARQKKEFEQDKANSATTEANFVIEDKIDPLKAPLVDVVVNKKTTAYLYIPRASDVPVAIDLYRDYQFKTVFVLGPECYKAAKLLKSAQDKWQIPMIIDSRLEVTERDPITGKETEVCTAKAYYDAGLIFALSATGESYSRRMHYVRNPSASSARSTRAQALPWWQVATCVRWGIPEEVAIAAFTTIPASILGMSDRIGTLEKGMDADLQILAAEPLEPESQVEKLIVQGEVIYDRSTDPRVKELSGIKTSAPEKNGK